MLKPIAQEIKDQMGFRGFRDVPYFYLLFPRGNYLFEVNASLMPKAIKIAPISLEAIF